MSARPADRRYRHWVSLGSRDLGRCVHESWAKWTHLDAAENCSQLCRGTKPSRACAPRAGYLAASELPFGGYGECEASLSESRCAYVAAQPRRSRGVRAIRTHWASAARLVVSPSEYFLLGRMQYRQTLPLNDREVVLTFDDGPLPPYSDRVLDILAKECVKATFFLVGRMARANPAAVRRIYNAGHTVGTHSQNHPIRFDRISGARIGDEIDDGIASVIAALGDAKALAPYFRIPGLGRTPAVEAHLRSRVAGGVELGHAGRRLAQDQRQPGAASRAVAAGAEGQGRAAAARYPAAHGAGAAGAADGTEATRLQDRACRSGGRAAGVAGEAAMVASASNGGLAARARAAGASR